MENESQTAVVEESKLVEEAPARPAPGTVLTEQYYQRQRCLEMAIGAADLAMRHGDKDRGTVTSLTDTANDFYDFCMGAADTKVANAENS